MTSVARTQEERSFRQFKHYMRSDKHWQFRANPILPGLLARITPPKKKVVRLNPIMRAIRSGISGIFN